MPLAFLAKLRRGGELTEADEAMLRQSVEEVVYVEAGRILLRSGVKPLAVQIILDGMACRQKTTRNL